MRGCTWKAVCGWTKKRPQRNSRTDRRKRRVRASEADKDDVWIEEESELTES
jgi:hypothetical protein